MRRGTRGRREKAKAEAATRAKKEAEQEAKKETKEKAKQIMEEDTRIEARFGGKDQWYPGVITGVNFDGSFDILYDDGDKETYVTRDLIRFAEESDGDGDGEVEADGEQAQNDNDSNAAEELVQREAAEQQVSKETDPLSLSDLDDYDDDYEEDEASVAAE